MTQLHRARIQADKVLDDYERRVARLSPQEQSVTAGLVIRVLVQTMGRIAEEELIPREAAPSPPPLSPPPIVTEDTLTPAQAAGIIGVSRQTLAAWRAENRYPLLKFATVGTRVRYPRADVMNFIKGRSQ
jgi:excisionase family DNA binding protein